MEGFSRGGEHGFDPTCDRRSAAGRKIKFVQKKTSGMRRIMEIELII